MRKTLIIFLIIFSISSMASAFPRVGFGGQFGGVSFLELGARTWLNSRVGAKGGWAYFPTLRQFSGSLQVSLKIFEIPSFWDLPYLLDKTHFSIVGGRCLLPDRLFLPSNTHVGVEIENGGWLGWYVQYLYAFYDAWRDFDFPDQINPPSAHYTSEIGLYIYF